MTYYFTQGLRIESTLIRYRETLSLFSFFRLLKIDVIVQPLWRRIRGQGYRPDVVF